MHGYIVPNQTGNYTFWIATDDQGELWLSTDETPGNQRLIASVSGWTSSREWSREASQQSALIRLEANRAYYIAALQKEGGGGDNLAVKWQRPDGVEEGPIPATYLFPWGTAFGPPLIVAQPKASSAVEGGIAKFTVELDPTRPATVQWQKNGVNISGENAKSPALEYGPVLMADHGASFRAIVTNSKGTVNSSPAVLSVMPDTTAPTVESILNRGTSSILVTFSELVDAASAATSSNYQVNNGVTVQSAVVNADGLSVSLTVSPLAIGSTYTVTINNVRDRAATPNTIANANPTSFTAVELIGVNIGNLASGQTSGQEGSFEISAKGLDIGGSGDVFHFGYQERTGDFDIRVRVANLDITDPLAVAGLMARHSLATNSSFAAIFGSSAEAGNFFQARTPTSATAPIIWPAGGFPVNYPNNWLRLRRSGSTFTGFASFDGKEWQQLGSASISMPAKIYTGLAVTSQSSETSATARFSEYGPVSAPTTFTYQRIDEPIGPSNRRTGLTFSEIMYNPPARSDGKDLEFVEIYSSETIFTDMTGWKISGGISYNFPDGYIIPAGSFVVIAANPEAVRSVYGIQNVLGPYTGKLNNAGDVIELRNKAGALRLEVEYGNDQPWPVAADGGGSSMVLARPSYGENDARAWGASQKRGGSPGNVEPAVRSSFSGVVINEILAHTDAPAIDFIELHNSTNRTMDLSGYILTDDAQTNKFVIPVGTSLERGSQIAFDQLRLGFALSSEGETVFLISPDGSEIIDAIKFGAQENGVASGRFPDGDPTFRRLTSPTANNPNNIWRAEDIVINEIMYQPITREDADQYVELYNRSSSPIDLSGWSFISGIDYIFPSGASIPAGGYVVVGKNKSRLLAIYPQLNAANTYGDYNGSLRGSGERVALAKPDLNSSTNQFGQVETTIAYQVVSEVTYADGGRWHDLADGGGSSLELIDPRADILRAGNWAASDETAKGEWASFEYTSRLDNGSVTGNRFLISMLGAGECLIDELELFRSGSTNVLRNPGFENGLNFWSFHGNHSASFLDATQPYEGSRSLHVRAQGDGDTANNTIRTPLPVSFGDGQIVTIRAKVRWLSGWPEVLLRVKGGWIEFPIRMNVPRNLGTPGLANSRKVQNAGPAIYDVQHFPILPKANEAVVVTCRLSDPDQRLATLRYRIDPSSSLTSVVMKDDGTSGDALAGDGIFSGRIAARPAGTLVAFRIEASDDASPAGKSLFPAEAPAKECLIRWGDANPGGTFLHYHMWTTAATDNARTSGSGLNNTFRDSTLVYGNWRVIYNVGYRDKGSPYHGGRGDFALTTPSDDMLLGVTDRIFASTGNGGSEDTGLRTDVSGWIGEKLGISFLHSHYMRLFFNGNQYQEIMYDMEQPNRDYARSWWGGDSDYDDLFKISIWFEFEDDNSNFQATGATLNRHLSNGALKVGRYRWNWQPRPGGTNASDFSALFNLINAANQSDRVTQLVNVADMDNWMRAVVYNRLLGNWDAYPTGGQNMYMYAPEGGRARLLPWDIDFVLGVGSGATDGLWGSGDGVMAALIDTPTYRRMLWRAYQDAVDEIFNPTHFNPQVDYRRKMLVKNGANLSTPTQVKAYAADRRNYIMSQLRNANTANFAITSNGGTDFTSASASTQISGTAPFEVAFIEVNGISFPIAWTGMNNWRITVPLGAATNVLLIVAKDSRGNVVTNGSKTITAKYTGTPPQPQDYVVINEIMYHPAIDDAEFVELHNRHTTVPFDLSGWRLSGLSFAFPSGTFLPPNGYLVVAADRAAFATAYGGNIAVAAVYDGRLDNSGETIRLIKPDFTVAGDIIIDEVAYERTAPWPSSADGLGASLQLIDPSQDNWRVGNWHALPPGAANEATPGRVNSGKTFLAEFPKFWINEVLSQNGNGATDQSGEREPWVELYNSGSATLDLNQYYLTDDLGSLAKWQFPPGSTLAPSTFLRILVLQHVGDA
ncbi:MAG: lamin tail domain-containing protein, partial [Verrucomicrobiales bacterium]